MVVRHSAISAAARRRGRRRLSTEDELPTRPPQPLLPGLPTGVQPGTHPLLPVLRWAEQGLPAIEKLKDYSATLVRRERIRDKLTNYKFVFIKVRHRPFSVYAHFQSPAAVKGQEVIYVAGRNQGRMWAHSRHLPVTASLFPDGLIAMSNRRYPLTEIGLVNLVRRLVEVGKQDLKYGECEVNYFRERKSTRGFARSSKWSIRCRGTFFASTWPGSSSMTS